MRNTKGEILTLPSSKTLVREYGDGEYVFVVNGGPGLGSNYTYQAFCQFKVRCRFIFFDQLGSGETISKHLVVTGKDITYQLQELIEAISPGDSISLLSHSWGSHVVYDLLANFENLNIGRTYFVEPIPPKWSDFERVVNKIWARVPANLKKQYEDALNSRPDQAIEEHNNLLPFYVSDPAKAKEIDIDSFSGSTLESVYSSVEGYDYTDIFKSISHQSMCLVLGTNSFISIKDLGGFEDVDTRTIAGVAHYPFCEDPAGFAEALPELFSLDHRTFA